MNSDKAIPLPRLMYTRRSATRGGLAGLAMLCASCRAEASPGPTIRVTAFDARGDGRSDDSRAFQEAVDSLREGGTIEVPEGRYSIDSVRVSNRNVTIALDDNAVLIKRGMAGPNTRGIFVLDGLAEAGFVISGGTVDLNGEGPRGIGLPGRIPNRYHHLTIATVSGIAGPANAAVFARRSSGITIRRMTILNSGENGLLFRNCGHINVHACRFFNLANYAIEFSFTDGASDGGSGPMPSRNNCTVTDCHFEGIDDYALGSGNGGGIGGGGGARLGRFSNYRIANCTFVRCHRDIHFEFQNGSWIEQFAITGIRSIEPRQGSIGLVAARRGEIADVSITNPGSAPAALLIPARPEIFGIVLSTDFSEVTLRNISITDERGGRQFQGGGATIARGSNRLTVREPVFTARDRGAWAGIARGNPEGTAYVGQIVQVLSSSEVQLDLPVGASVNGGRFAVGGLTRNGLIFNSGSDVTLENVRIVAGAAGDAQGDADAAAIRMQDMRGTVRFSNVILIGPQTSRAKPAGLRLLRNQARMVGIESVSAQGFAQARRDER